MSLPVHQVLSEIACSEKEEGEGEKEELKTKEGRSYSCFRLQTLALRSMLLDCKLGKSLHQCGTGRLKCE